MAYPLGKYEKDSIRSKSGKRLADINLEAVVAGNVSGEDIKISKETLRKQAAISLEHDNPEMAASMERAAELVDVPDQVILEMYNKLRPNRSTKGELEAMAKTLEEEYGALHCGKMVREALAIYEKRGILL